MKLWEKVKEGAGKVRGAAEKAKPNLDTVTKIREWLVNVMIKAIGSCSDEKDRAEILTWLTRTRKVVSDPNLSFQAKLTGIYKLIDTGKTFRIVMNSVSETVKNYKNADLPLPVKIAIPATLGAAAVVGGQGAGLAAFGGAIGMPVIILVFLGTAGLTAVIQGFFTEPRLIGMITGMIVKDEILRRVRKSMKEAMQTAPAYPKYADVPEEERALRDALLKMDPYDFERHVMSFFQNKGLFSWVTKKIKRRGC